MYDVGVSLLLIKDFESYNNSYNKYTLNNKYKILFIKDTLYYIENDETSNTRDFLNKKSYLTYEENQKKIIKECSIWFENDINEYFINIKEQRKNKIKEILKSNGE